MSAKRGPQKGGGGGKGSNPVKKVKTDGPDIPSSNFASIKNKQPSKYTLTAQQITSLSSSRQNLQNPAAILKSLNLPSVYKEAMGDSDELKKFAKDKAKREADMKRKGQSVRPQSAQPPKREPVEEDEYKPKMVTQDEQGRIRDEKGNIINLKPANTSSLIVNKNIERRKNVDDLLKPQKGFGNRNSKIFDPTVSSKSQTFRDRRKNNAFQFVEKGSILKKAEVLRGQSEPSLDASGTSTLNDTLSKLEAIGTQTPASDAVPGGRRTTVRVKRHDPVPDVEWWDAPLLIPGRRSYLPEDVFEQEKEAIQKEKYETEKIKKTDENGEGERMDEEGNEAGNSVNKEGLIERLKKNLQIVESAEFTGNIYNKEKINKVIEHPASFKTDGNQNAIIPTYLTKDERQKLRRKKRLEREKDKQEKIRLGLMKAPPPKMKFKNFMDIVKDEAVANPTKVEMEVRRQIQERLQNHLDRNAKKKLTKDQKAEKYMRKLRRDSAAECRVAVFRVEDLSHGAHKFKVNMNAQQLALNGVCIIADKKLGLGLPSVVVVEGGPKAIKFYKKLMLRRVNWNLRNAKAAAAAAAAAAASAMGEGEPEKTLKPQIENKCILVWEGVLKDHNFNKWKVADVKSELEGRRILADRGVEFYWDRALTSSEVADEDN